MIGSLLLSFLASGAMAAGLISNGDFEQGIQGWSLGHGWYEQPAGAGMSEVALADGAGRDGSRALRITGKQNRGITMQVFPAYPGRYRVAGWIRCEGLGAGEAVVLAEWMDGQTSGCAAIPPCG